MLALNTRLVCVYQTELNFERKKRKRKYLEIGFVINLHLHDRFCLLKGYNSSLLSLCNNLFLRNLNYDKSFNCSNLIAAN